MHLRLSDLIETYWDVKTSASIAFVHQSGFNRNILGCKEGKRRETACGVVDLIETYWDVKIKVKSTKVNMNRDLIETYWDVKTSQKKKKIYSN